MTGARNLLLFDGAVRKGDLSDLTTQDRRSDSAHRRAALVTVWRHSQGSARLEPRSDPISYYQNLLIAVLRGRRVRAAGWMFIHRKWMLHNMETHSGTRPVFGDPDECAVAPCTPECLPRGAPGIKT